MPLLLLILLAGVMGYFLWRRRMSSLRRTCRWRQQRSRNRWNCSYCGAVVEGAEAPVICRNPSAP